MVHKYNCKSLVNKNVFLQKYSVSVRNRVEKPWYFAKHYEIPRLLRCMQGAAS